MPRFFLNIRNGLGFIPDDEGQELPSAEHARDEAVKGARSLLSAEVSEGRLDLRGRIEVTDGQGKITEVVQFRDVVHILTVEFPSSNEKKG